MVALRDRKHQRKPEERLDVEASLFHVVPFPLMGFDTLLIHSKSSPPGKLLSTLHSLYYVPLNCQKFIFLLEEFGFHRRVRHKGTLRVRGALPSFIDSLTAQRKRTRW